MFLKQQISVLELFLNEHVTLKTGIMPLKIQLGHLRNKLQFKMYYNTKQLFNMQFLYHLLYLWINTYCIKLKKIVQTFEP